MNILGALADKKGAKKIYEELSKEFIPDEKLEIRTHRYLKKLNEAWRKLNLG